MPRRGHQARPRNQYSWTRFQVQTGAIVASAVAQAGINLGSINPASAGETVRRIRGSVFTSSLLAVGPIMTRVVAYVEPEGNVAGFLNPVNVVEQNSDLYMMVVTPTVEVSTATGFFYNVEVDVKAMRKLEQGSVLRFAMQTTGNLIDLLVDFSVLTAPIAS